MAWLNKNDNNDKANSYDVEVPSLPPIKESKFEVKNNDNEIDNDEAEILEVDEENKCGDSIGKVLDSSKFAEEVATLSVNMATRSIDPTNQLFCNYESLPASNEHPLYQFVSVKVAGV